jgi:hypothetical protein
VSLFIIFPQIQLNWLNKNSPNLINVKILVVSKFTYSFVVSLRESLIYTNYFVLLTNIKFHKNEKKMCQSLSNSFKLNKPTTCVMYAHIFEKMIVAQLVTNFQISTETECSLLMEQNRSYFRPQHKVTFRSFNL